MNNKNEIISKLTGIKDQMISLIDVSDKLERTEMELILAEIKLPFKVKLFIGILVLVIISLIAEPLPESALISLVGIGLSIYCGAFLSDKIYIKISTPRNKDELITKYDRLEKQWSQLAMEIYSNNIMPQRYLNPTYIDYMIECFNYSRADDLKEALDMLDEEIRHNESLEAMTNINNTIVENNARLYDAVKGISNKMDEANDNLRAIRKDISWTAYNTSKLRDRDYVGKAYDDFIRN